MLLDGKSSAKLDVRCFDGVVAGAPARAATPQLPPPLPPPPPAAAADDPREEEEEEEQHQPGQRWRQWRRRGNRRSGRCWPSTTSNSCCLIGVNDYGLVATRGKSTRNKTKHFFFLFPFLFFLFIFFSFFALFIYIYIYLNVLFVYLFFFSV